MSPNIGACMQRGPNFAAARTPFQLLTGCGSRQRSSPVGASAKGTPLKARTPEPWRPAPSTTPSAVLTLSGAKALAPAVVKSAAVKSAAAAEARSLSLTVVTFVLIHAAPRLLVARLEKRPRVL